MRLISKIEISYFRSFDNKVTVERCSDLNILSGKNDSGKSNVLRALNLFFSEDKVDFYNDLKFEHDFSKQRKNVAAQNLKAKQIFKIKILFNDVGYRGKVLPKQFWVEKSWDRYGQVTRKTKQTRGKLVAWEKPNNEGKYPRVEAATTTFLNKIKFFYVPAIKSDVYLGYLKDEYQKSLGVAINKLQNTNNGQKMTSPEWEETLTAGDIRELLAGKINSDAKKMLADFRSSAPEIKDSFLSIPNLDFSKTLEIQTEEDILLANRGDGVQAKFIPHMLNEIARNNGYRFVIWGFEEPENSFEYANAQRLAEDFRDIYSGDRQIFITSHSFNFLTLEGDNISRYRVYRKEDTSKIISIDDTRKLLNNEEELFEEIGIFDLSDELKKVYEEKKLERERLKLLVQRKNKIHILTEGSACKYIEILLDRYSDDWRQRYELPDNGGGSAQNLKNFVAALNRYSNVPKSIVLFDNDTAGCDAHRQLRQLPKPLHENLKAFILPELEWAKNWEVKNMLANDKAASKCDLNGKALPIEMYFWRNFKGDCGEQNRLFEQHRDITLRDGLKDELRDLIENMDRTQEIPDGKKIVELIESIEFTES